MMNKLNKFFKQVCIAVSILVAAATFMSASAITVMLIESDYGSYKTYTISTVHSGMAGVDYTVVPISSPNVPRYPQQAYAIPTFINMPGYPQQAYTITTFRKARNWGEIDGLKVRNYTEAKEAIFRHFSKIYGAIETVRYLNAKKERHLLTIEKNKIVDDEYLGSVYDD